GHQRRGESASRRFAASWGGGAIGFAKCFEASMKHGATRLTAVHVTDYDAALWLMSPVGIRRPISGAASSLAHQLSARWRQWLGCQRRRSRASWRSQDASAPTWTLACERRRRR